MINNKKRKIKDKKILSHGVASNNGKFIEISSYTFCGLRDWESLTKPLKQTLSKIPGISCELAQ